MANGTYYGSYATSFYLTSAEPEVTFTSDVTISGVTGNGIVGGTAGAYTIVTAGTINAADAGIDLRDGGFIDNEAGGRIVCGTGIYFEGAGSIYNAGYIDGLAENGGAGIDIGDGGLITNIGTIEATTGATGMQPGIFAADDVSIVNLAGGTIAADGSGGNAVWGSTGDTISNSGVIESGVIAYYGGNTAILMSGGSIETERPHHLNIYNIAIKMSGGSVTNHSGGTITGQTGISFTGTASTVVNSGYIYASGAGISANSSVSVTNEDGGTISGRDAVVMADGGAVDNEAGAEINGDLSGIGIDGAAGTVENAGTITVTGGVGISLKDGGSVLNSGSIDAVAGVYVDDGGSVTNTAKGVIAGGSLRIMVTGDGGSIYNAGFIADDEANSVAISLGNDSALTNVGTIEATRGNYTCGISFGNDDSIVNQAGGTILASGSDSTALSSGDGATITNAGLIEETGGSNAILIDSGSVTNQSGGHIVGGVGIDLSNGSIYNAGYIEGHDPHGAGIRLSGVGTVTNVGTISASGNYAVGIECDDDETIVNLAGGTIESSGINGAAVGGFTGDTLINSGLIEQTGGGVAITIFDGTVTNERGGTITGQTGIWFDESEPTVVNSGYIYGSGRAIFTDSYLSVTNRIHGTITGKYAIVTADGGAVNNKAWAEINAKVTGISIGGAAGTVENAGTITVSGGTGISLKDGGSVLNSGSIDALVAVYVDDGGSVTNTAKGVIAGGESGITVTGAGGSVYNAGFIDGANGVGVGLGSGATLTNAGTIEGIADSVLLTAHDNLLIADKGADFIGLIQGGGVNEGNALELNSGLGTLTALGGTGTMTGQMSGTFTGFGTYEIQGGAWTLEGASTLGTDQIKDFGDLTLASGASLVTDGVITVTNGYFLDDGTLSGNGTITVDSGTVDLAESVSGISVSFAGSGLVDLSQSGQYGGVSIDNFGLGDTLDLTGVSYQPGETARYHSHHLYVYSSAHALLAEISMTEGTGFSGLKAVTDGHRGTLIETVICFMPGTRIATPVGEVAVERLAVGDLVNTLAGTPAPIRWIGRQTVSTKFGDPLRILPIRIEAGALGPNLPARDLLCSPDHAILIDDVLVQAGALVNGTTIRRETDVPEVFTYYHIECDGHELILAENVPAETFVDNIDRLAFDNWEEHLALYPNGKPVAELPYPRAKSLRQVPVAIRERLRQRDEAAHLSPSLRAA